jgi:predicted deacylase
MAGKQLMKLKIKDAHNDVETYIPLGIIEGEKEGPTLAVVGGIHASEYAAQDAVLRFWKTVTPENLAGSAIVVLAADVTAICAHHIYTNPVDRKNLNRSFPGKADGTLSDIIAHTLMEEVVRKADAVIDCHGGEFDEHMAPYVITSVKGDEALDEKTLGLAMALGVPFVEVADASGEWLGGNTLQGAAVLSGRPGMVIEAGGRGERDAGSVGVIYNALMNALRHLGMIPGTPVPWAGKPVRLKCGLLVKSTQAGLFESEVCTGDWIQEGSVFGRVLDFEGNPLEELRASDSGTVLTVIAARAVSANGFAGKIGVIEGYS